MSGFHRKTILAFTLLVATTVPHQARAQFSSFFDFGSVYTATNAPEGNQLKTWLRLPGGWLFPFPDTNTGGEGTGGGLGNQGGVTLSENGRWLLAVNAGSDSLSVFFVGLFGELYRTDVEPSGGDQPVSVTIDGRVVYVLNAADGGSIQGFRLGFFGNLRPINNSSQPLSGAAITAAAQIQFSQTGRQLVVTEKATNLIDVFQVDQRGRAHDLVTQASNGATPFGFDFDAYNRLIVSEAFGGAPDASAVSSYDLENDGTLTTISASVPDTETAACWIEITEDGRFAYTTNTGSGTVSGYAIDPASGALTLLDADGVTGDTGAGSGPIDVAITRGSRYLYVLNSGTGEIVGFRVNSTDGSLTHVTTVSGLPAGTNGMSAR